MAATRPQPWPKHRKQISHVAENALLDRRRAGHARKRQKDSRLESDKAARTPRARRGKGRRSCQRGSTWLRRSIAPTRNYGPGPGQHISKYGFRRRAAARYSPAGSEFRPPIIPLMQMAVRLRHPIARTGAGAPIFAIVASVACVIMKTSAGSSRAHRLRRPLRLLRPLLHPVYTPVLHLVCGNITASSSRCRIRC